MGQSAYKLSPKIKKLMKKYGISMTYRGYEKLQDMYEKNYQKMVKYQGKPNQIRYTEKEKNLNDIQVVMQGNQGLGIISDELQRLMEETTREWNAQRNYGLKVKESEFDSIQKTP